MQVRTLNIYSSQVHLLTTSMILHLLTGSRIICFSTSLTMSTSVPPNHLLYVATKGAVQQITRVLGKGFGTKGITVNYIAPGLPDTIPFPRKSDTLSKHFENYLGMPDETAPIVALLAREDSSWVNGQTWYIDDDVNV